MNPKIVKNAAAPPAHVCSRDESDDSDSSLAHSSKMGQSSGTCGRGTARQNSASQQPDSSKEWMFQGNAAVLNVIEVDWDDVKDVVPVPDEVRKGFPEVGEQLKATFSENSPAEFEYIVIISDIAQVSCDVHQNEKYLGVPVRGYVATIATCYSKGVGGFDSVVQNISLGQRSLAEYAAGSSSTLIEMQ
jgi:hypothetical protein